MAFNQTDLDTLDRAIASGELTVRIADRLVTYRALSELIQAREIVSAQIALAAIATRPYPRHQLADFRDE